MNLQHKFSKGRMSPQRLERASDSLEQKAMATVRSSMNREVHGAEIRDDGKKFSMPGGVNTNGTPAILSSGSENGASNINTGGTQTNNRSSGGGKRKRQPKLVVPDSEAGEGQDPKTIHRKVTRRSANGGTLGFPTESKIARRHHGKADVKFGPPAQHHSGSPSEAGEGQDSKSIHRRLRPRSLNGAKTGFLTVSKSAGRVPSTPPVNEGPIAKHHSEPPPKVD